MCVLHYRHLLRSACSCEQNGWGKRMRGVHTGMGGQSGGAGKKELKRQQQQIPTGGNCNNCSSSNTSQEDTILKQRYRVNNILLHGGR